MFHKLRHKLSIRLAFFLTCVVVPSLVIIGGLIIIREVQVTKQQVLKEAKTAAISGAAAYAQILEDGIDSGQLTMADVLDPVYDEMKFVDDKGILLGVEDARFNTKVGDYTDKHGIQRLQDSIMVAGDFLFASGMDRGGYVPTPHKHQSYPPKGTATKESMAWDRKFSRGKRKYDKDEQIAAARYTCNHPPCILVQDYPRDTGEAAWDVASPITVKGKHFGAFRVGVAQDRIIAQQRELVLGLGLLFGLVSLTTVLSVFWVSWTYMKPLTRLAKTVGDLSLADTCELSERIVSTDAGEVGEMAKAADRLRASLHAAMVLLERSKP